MNPLRFLAPLLFLAAPMLSSAIEVRLSVKFIRDSAGNNPTPAAMGTTSINTPALFELEVAKGNVALALMARGHRLRVVEYLYIQPPAPNGQPANFWYDIAARENVAQMEAAALADTATWAWNPNAINIFVNNTISGQCSFVGQGQAISLGRQIGSGTVTHEIGHFFNLRHTHGAADNDNMVGDWLDGDGLSETLPDDPDATFADINARYPDEAQKKRDDLFFNIMSYHQEDFFLPPQMNIWTTHSNGARQFACDGQTYFVAPFPYSNSDPQFNGVSSFFPAFLERALALSSNAQDVLLFQRNYPILIPGEHIVINQACIIAAPNEPVTIGGDSL